MPIFTLAVKSILNRKLTVSMTIFSIALSILLLLGVERLRHDARESFTNTISGTDLIVGARSGQVQLLLYSIFRIGNPTNNVSWKSYQDLKSHPLVEWTVPLSLGDSHKGFRVLGTNQDYFTHYRYAAERTLVFATGHPFSAIQEAVIGADVATQLNYSIGQEIILAHGTGEVSFTKHADQPFKVVGILKKTGTPVDRTVHVSLESIEAIHAGWQEGSPPSPVLKRLLKKTSKPLQPKTITAALVGLKSPIATFKVQRFINEYPEEPLLAALPGVALQELWDTMAIAQQALLAISIMVVLVGICGMATAILTSLNERRREMAILRSVGAKPWHIFLLLIGEAFIVMVLAVVLGLAALYIVQLIGRPIIENEWGLYLPTKLPSLNEYILLGCALLAGVLAGIIPAYRAYRYSLADGMTIRS